MGCQNFYWSAFMLQIFKNVGTYVCLFYACLAITPKVNASVQDALIVSYVTAHSNFLSNVVQGVLVTPSGDVLKTEAMGSFGSQKIVINNPENGSYLAYFQALIEVKPKYCYIIGGIDAHLCSQPSHLIPFSPMESHIQGFTQSKTIRVGDSTLPIASFQLPPS